jgi:glycosyltransferase involved in cell wall biosynthesis
MSPFAGVTMLGQGSGAGALSAAADRAAAHGHLVVLLGSVIPDAAVVRGLIEALDFDPLVGFAMPRFADEETDDVLPLPDGADGGDGGSPSIPRAGATLLPPQQLTTELLAACLVVRREVAAAFARPPRAPLTLLAALLAEAVEARRRGFRTLVMNRLVVRSRLRREQLYPAPAGAELAALISRYPDMVSAGRLRSDGASRRFERLASVSRRAVPTSHLPVLIDARGIQAHHNGTSEASLGLLDGITAEHPAWQVDLLVSEGAVGYHRLEHRFPSMNVLTALPDRAYAAAIRLDQPWHLSTVEELHQRALAITFNILDTIAWDVVYVSPLGLDATWGFVAEHSDALLFNSSFSRDRFGFRFTVGPEVEQVVTLHSLDPDEYLEPGMSPSTGGQILIFGNHLDHKAVAPTVELLARAFPYQDFLAIGAPSEPTANTSSLRSGQIPAAEVDRLVRSAPLVVFPSFYEGFGLPVVKSLAYGKPVLVRASPLWRELAAQTRAAGQLVEFVTSAELVELVGRVLHGAPLASLTLGSTLGADRPVRWRDCSRRLIDGVERMVLCANHRRWARRDRALALSHR